MHGSCARLARRNVRERGDARPSSSGTAAVNASRLMAKANSKRWSQLCILLEHNMPVQRHPVRRSGEIMTKGPYSRGFSAACVRPKPAPPHGRPARSVGRGQEPLGSSPRTPLRLKGAVPSSERPELFSSPQHGRRSEMGGVADTTHQAQRVYRASLARLTPDRPYRRSGPRRCSLAPSRRHRRGVRLPVPARQVRPGTRRPRLRPPMVTPTAADRPRFLRNRVCRSVARCARFAPRVSVRTSAP